MLDLIRHTRKKSHHTDTTLKLIFKLKHNTIQIPVDDDDVDASSYGRLCKSNTTHLTFTYIYNRNLYFFYLKYLFWTWTDYLRKKKNRKKFYSLDLVIQKFKI